MFGISITGFLLLYFSFAIGAWASTRCILLPLGIGDIVESRGLHKGQIAKEIRVAAFWITLVVLYNLGDAIESVAHLRGAMLASQRDASRNNAWLGILTLGEGWHANHHRFPRSARHGLLRGQFDLIWQIIVLLSAAGLTTKIQLPKEDVCR